MQWAVISSLIAVTAGSVLLDEDDLSDRASEMSKCCAVEKLFPLDFFKNTIACISETAAEEEMSKGYCYNECILRRSKSLHADNTINEQATRTFFGGKLKPEGRMIMELALDSCFRTVKSLPIPEDTMCKSGSKKLINCLLTSIPVNCPEDLWKKENPECRKVQEMTEDIIID